MFFFIIYLFIFLCQPGYTWTTWETNTTCVRSIPRATSGRWTECSAWVGPSSTTGWERGKRAATRTRQRRRTFNVHKYVVIHTLHTVHATTPPLGLWLCCLCVCEREVVVFTWIQSTYIVLARTVLRLESGGWVMNIVWSRWWSIDCRKANNMWVHTTAATTHQTTKGRYLFVAYRSTAAVSFIIGGKQRVALLAALHSFGIYLLCCIVFCFIFIYSNHFLFILCGI